MLYWRSRRATTRGVVRVGAVETFSWYRRGAILAGLLAAGLLAGCLARSDPGEAHFDTAQWRGDTDWDTAMARSEATLAADPKAGVVRRNGHLELTLTDGRPVTVAEDRACATRLPRDIWHDCLRKYAIWHFPRRGFWLLAVRLYAGEAYALVDTRTGQETRLIGPPHFAPDGRHLVATNSALQGGDTVSGVEVWSLTGPQPELVFYRAAHLEEGFRFIDWAGNTTARLTVQGHERAPREAVLSFANSRWQLSRPH